MVAKFLEDASLFQFLLQVDVDIAKAAKAKGCPRCSDTVDVANFSRQPRGGPAGLGDDAALRFSFSCRAEGCRRRVTPPSSRFLGRKVYFGVVVVIASAMMGDLGKGGRAALSRHFGADRHTLRRWKKLFDETFPRMPAWKLIAGRIMPPLDSDNRARSLLKRFSVNEYAPPEDYKSLSDLLILISPLACFGQEF
jgi:hypothetical protein